jgi:hypothetical protein
MIARYRSVKIAFSHIGRLVPKMRTDHHANRVCRGTVSKVVSTMSGWARSDVSTFDGRHALRGAALGDRDGDWDGFSFRCLFCQPQRAQAGSFSVIGGGFCDDLLLYQRCSPFPGHEIAIGIAVGRGFFARGWWCCFDGTLHGDEGRLPFGDRLLTKTVSRPSVQGWLKGKAKVTFLYARDAPRLVPDIDVVIKTQRATNEDGRAIISTTMVLASDITIAIVEKIELIMRHAAPFIIKREREHHSARCARCLSIAGAC